eukprot:TRINITY_DN67615_c6_g1_i2.p1 TRINITY_DN67615_c6_g1~~TRINITY_DN67615_c6_g1_i2.p1  ORF type:complete len:251 (-),score=-3.23 TRINITY_DN67615_c6_g1_i2:33-785(-)
MILRSLFFLCFFCVCCADSYVLWTLGAVIYYPPRSTSAIPATSAQSRCDAAAVLRQRLEPTPHIFTCGGYNIGVRYAANGTLIPTNRTFAAFANARKYSSEAFTMKSYLESKWKIPFTEIGIEETSFDTTENAELSALILYRLALLHTLPKALTVGVVTNLYHMGRALPDFVNANHNPSVDFEPFYVEDWVCLIPPTPQLDWIQVIVSLYKKLDLPHCDVSVLEGIMRKRAAGNLKVSVAQLAESCADGL